jgi:hypothetical protein
MSGFLGFAGSEQRQCGKDVRTHFPCEEWLGVDEEIDLRERLRFAANALAADFGGNLTADHAEALVFSSAEGLLATASVTEFVPILAERRARLAVRSGAAAPPVTAAAPPVTVAAPPVTAAVPTNESTVAPLISVPDETMNRLRDHVDRVRVRVSDWRAELDLR